MKSLHIILVFVALMVMQSCTNFVDKPTKFQVSTNELVFSVKGETLSLRITSGTKWDVICLPEWVKVTSISQSGLSSYEWDVSFTVSANDGYNREGTLFFNAEHERAAISFFQEGEKGTFPVKAIDMGLSVKWASFNLGALKPEEYGDYYAWGEVSPDYCTLIPLTWKEGKVPYYISTYKWCMGESNSMTKYCVSSDYGFNGFSDGKTVLDPEDDAATVNWGSTWRIPTEKEWEALLNDVNFDWTWTDNFEGTGVVGHVVTSKIPGFEGNSIFFPAAGSFSGYNNIDKGFSGYYWSSSLSLPLNFQGLAVTFNKDQPTFVHWKSHNRTAGLSIRPVTE